MSQPQPVKARIWVSGRVQGVGYRMFARDEARCRGLLGGVRNLGDGRVEVEVEGERGAVEAFISELRAGPPMARVIDLQVQWEPAAGRHVDFSVWH
jgi:acylphosphatase